MVNTSFYVNLINANVNMLITARRQRARAEARVGIRGRSGKNHLTSVEKAKEKKIPLIMKEKFEEAWKRQEDEISKHNITLKDEWSYTEYEHYRCGGWEKVYDDGKIAEECSYSESCNDKTIRRYDRLGNCVQKGSSKYTYYKGTNKKEFEWTKDGIKHFDKEGNDNTDKYYKIHQIASKRVKAEGKGIVYPKMSRLEKAVAMINVDKDELTRVERMLIRKKERE